MALNLVYVIHKIVPKALPPFFFDLVIACALTREANMGKHDVFLTTFKIYPKVFGMSLRKV
jgi:hypothetical protein